MATTTPIRFVRSKHDQEKSSLPVLSLVLGLTAGIVLFFLVMLILAIGYRLIYIGRIFPGVSIAGVDVSGLSESAASRKIEESLTFPATGRITFRFEQNTWEQTPANLGMIIDSNASAKAAFNLGRNQGIFQNLNDELNARQVGVVVPPVISFDQNIAKKYLENLAANLDQPAQEASLVIEGVNVISKPGKVGRKLDVDSTLVYLYSKFQAFRDGEVPLVMLDQPPLVIDSSNQADTARKILSNPFTIALPDAHPGDPGPWQIQPSELGKFLRVGRNGTQPGSRYQVQFDFDMLKNKLETIRTEVDRPEADARFLFDDQTGQIQPIQPSKIGLRIDLKSSIDDLQKAIADGQQTASLRVNTTTPKVEDTATSQQLGIGKLISSQTTYFYGSNASRRTNIKAAASKFNGLLVAPGAVFSMGQYMGDISLDSGFAEALIIYNGKTIKGVGGGVCQVSTTLFRTVFFAGLPVVERHAHAYRVLYYEQAPDGHNNPSLSGFDATVYFPLVDFKFKNDTPYWILMETVYDDASSSLTWKFYSTPDGRKVDATFSGPTNIVPAPPPVITFNPDAASGSVAHVDYAVDGADVTINRTVTMNGQVYITDKFFTQYEPWPDTCEYGPNVKDPEKILKKRGLCQK